MASWEEAAGEVSGSVSGPGGPKSPEGGLFGSTETVQAESRAPPAVLFPPLLPRLLPPSRGGTGSPPGWDAPRAGRTDTSESETGILRGKTAAMRSNK